MEETLKVLKKEKAKILAKIEANGDNLYGEGSVFKTAEEYQIVIGLLFNATASIQNIEQSLELKKAQAEHLESLKQQAKEAKEE